METTNNNPMIDYKLAFKKVWQRRRLYCIVLVATFVLSSLFIICFPREYISSTVIAPETEDGLSGGALSSLASSFGFDLGNMQSSVDAITPILYPELMDDNGFVSSLLSINVKSLDGTISTNYYNYLDKYQSYTWWEFVYNKIKRVFQKKDINLPDHFDPYHVSRHDEGIFHQARKYIQIGTNKKTGVITITVTAQDALICKTLADSVSVRLQNFITEYRTNKARNDYEYYDELAQEAKKDYEQARRLYDDYSDANMDIYMQKYRSKQEDLENDLQLKYNTYTGIMMQLNAARSKLQDKIPAFTTIKGASVPIKPDKPKRMIFVLVWLVIAFFITTVYVLRNIILPENK